MKLSIKHDICRYYGLDKLDTKTNPMYLSTTFFAKLVNDNRFKNIMNDNNIVIESLKIVNSNTEKSEINLNVTLAFTKLVFSITENIVQKLDVYKRYELMLTALFLYNNKVKESKQKLASVVEDFFKKQLSSENDKLDKSGVYGLIATLEKDVVFKLSFDCETHEIIIGGRRYIYGKNFNSAEKIKLEYLTSFTYEQYQFVLQNFTMTSKNKFEIIESEHSIQVYRIVKL